MLEYLKLENLGPAPQLEFEFGPRINILTGDNGLGKTFVLDLAWWVLTNTWADNRVIHPSISQDKSRVRYRLSNSHSLLNAEYDKSSLDWSSRTFRHNSALILYARIDGGFSVWDPAISKSLIDHPKINALQFTKNQLWNGLYDEQKRPLCRGLLDDWESWRLKNNGVFKMLQNVLRELSPKGEGAVLTTGESVRLPDSGAREIPTLHMPYGTTPIIQASAGIRRILSLAYMIVWAWTEHQIHASLRGKTPAPQIVLLWDEVEAHLHPQWQRTIFPSVVRVLDQYLRHSSDTRLQVIATTHAPLVLASLETTFNSNTDRLFNLQLDKTGKVELEKIPWAKQGDVIHWLRSPAFDMVSGYSREAERAIQAACNFLADRPDRLPKDLNTREAIYAELTRTLAPEDPFWPRWIVQTQPKGARA